LHTTSNRLIGVRRWLLPLTAVLFFGSGVSALIYQTLWLRLLALVFGVTDGLVLQWNGSETETEYLAAPDVLERLPAHDALG
jgi:hypothetical protein